MVNLNKLTMGYIQYYQRQNGGGISDVGELYHSPIFLQRGRGIGNVFKGLMKHLRPLLKSGVNALKEQSVKSANAIVQDLGNKPLKDILKEQGKLAATNLVNRSINRLNREKQEGSGFMTPFRMGAIKRKHTDTLTHLNTKQGSSKVKKRKTTKKKTIKKSKKKTKKRNPSKKSKQKRILDIFD